jgi:NADPH:quinone reductase-like Zn-dependent oxidoreductase
MPDPVTTGLQLRTLIKPEGELELTLVDDPVPEPRADEVVVRVEAVPINPSDIGLLFGAADMTTARATGTPGRPVVTAKVPPAAMAAMAARVGQSMPAGNEGAGIVVAAGSSKAAQALTGRTVAVLGGAMYAQYRCIPAAQCLPLPAGTTPAEGASAFVNPLTALGMVETMRREGHRALVHTAAASNLGQMLNRICIEDGVALVNIVRKADQAALLREQGAKHVLDSSQPTFMQDLVRALTETGATIGFDATGGGRLAGQILSAMEAALAASAREYSRYGTNVHKQVYIYGGLEPGPTELARNFGMTWGLGGWLLFPFLQKIGPETAERLKGRVAANLKTTFASHYARVIGLAEMLTLDAIAGYNRRATGEKFLVDPSRKA